MSKITKNLRRISYQALVCFVSFVLVLNCSPEQRAQAQTTEPTKIKPFVLNHPQPRHQASLTLIRSQNKFSAVPTDHELSRACILPGPLTPITASKLSNENAALVKALLLFEKGNDPENTAPLKDFLRHFPTSRWAPSLELNLGLLCFQTGYLTQALSFYQSSWNKAKTQTGPNQQSFASRACAELAMLNTRLGRESEARECLQSLKGRTFLGGSESIIKATEEGLALMRADPTNSFKCGPYALNTLLYLKTGAAPCVDARVRDYPSTLHGTNLDQLREFSTKLGLNYQMAKRAPGAPIVVPSVMHWRTQHFSAITKTERSKFRIQDPTFGPSSSAWVSSKAVDQESDGYFLIPEGPLQNGWQKVNSEDAKKVWGKGVPVARNTCKLCKEDQEDMDACSSGGCGMPVASAMSMNATVHIVDTPLQSSPPIGPNMGMTFTYNAYEGNQPFNTFFSNVGYNWSLNWFSYMAVDASQNITVNVPGGGFETYANNGGSNPYMPNIITQASILPLAGGGYQRLLPNGATQNYTLALSQLGVSYYLMTSRADAQGNAATISYDTLNRVSTITDACGNVYTFDYYPAGGYNQDLLLKSISDSFGRSMSLSYDPITNYITSITDAAGNVSTFTTESYPWPHTTAMSTPYGTTRFDEVGLGGAATDITYGTKFTFPDGSKAVIKNSILSYKDTYYWDREAMARYPSEADFNVYSHCKRTHWLWEPLTNSESPVKAWEQKPLETLTSYTYPNQSNSNDIGSLNTPTSATRLLAGNRGFSLDVLAAGIQEYDTANLIFCDPGLPGNNQIKLSYVIQATDTVDSIAAALATLVNANISLNNLGITSEVSANRLFIKSLSPNATSIFDSVDTTSAHFYATEFLHLNLNQNIGQTVSIGGEVSPGDTITLTVVDGGLTGGQKAVNYTAQNGDDLSAIASNLSTAINSDTDLQTVHVSAAVLGSTITLSSLSNNNTSYQASTSSGATETIAIASTAQVAQYQYNPIGNLTKSIDPVGRTFSYSYASNDIDLLEKRETKGSDNFLLDHWEYGDSNSPHLPTVYIDGSGQHTQFTYNALKELEATTDALGGVTTRSYDSNGYLTQIDGPLDGTDDVTNFDYFGFGPPHTVTDSEGYQLVFTYDSLNRLVKTFYPDGTYEQTIFDRLDPILTSDRNGRWTQSSYDVMDNLVSVVDPKGQTTKFLWCVCGGIMSITDPLLQKTSWSRELEGRVISKTYADGTSTSYTYEPISGRLRTRTDAAAAVTTYEYNSDNSLSKKSYENGYLPTGPTSYSYDPAFPRLLIAENSTDWGNITNSYNDYVTDIGDPPITGGGKLASVTSNNNWVPSSTVFFGYDELGRTSSRSVDGTTYSATWSYDAMSRVTAEVNQLGTFNVHYIDDSPAHSKGTTRVSELNYPNGQTTRFDYYGNLQDQRLKQITNRRSDSSLLSQFAYVDDPSGQIIQWTQIQNEKSTFNSMSYDEAGQLTSVQTSDATPGNNLTNQRNFFYDAAGNISATQINLITKVKVIGVVTVGDTLTIAVNDAGLSAGSKSVSYTVQSGDNLDSVASKLAALISADSDMQRLGISAATTANVISVQSMSQNITSYAASKSVGATESLKIGVSKNFSELITISGVKTSGDTLSLILYDSALPGGSKTLSYTVQSGDTLEVIASNFKTAINSDVALQNLGVSALTANTTIALNSNSPNATTYGYSVSTEATEKFDLSVNQNEEFKVGLNGTLTPSDTLSISMFDPGLPSGVKTVHYVVQTGDTLPSVIAAMANSVNSDTSLQHAGITAHAAGKLLELFSISNNFTTYRQYVNNGATENLIAPLPQNGTQTAVVQGTVTSGDVVTLRVYDAGLPGGSASIDYTVQLGDTLESIATALAASLASNTNLQSIGLTSSSVYNVVNLKSTSVHATTYEQASSEGSSLRLFVTPIVGSTRFYCNNVNELTNTVPGGSIRVQANTTNSLKTAYVGDASIQLNSASSNATTYSGSSTGSETISFGDTTNGFTSAILHGVVNSGDVISLTIINDNLSGGSLTISYTAQSNDTLYSICDELTTLITSNASLEALGLTAFSGANAPVSWTKKFIGRTETQPGINNMTVVVADGANHIDAQNYKIGANDGASQSWIYDSVGNFGYGPIQGYSFDTENRFTQLDVYVPNAPKTYYQFDAFGRCVSITSWEEDIEVKHRIYVWSGDHIIQEQDSLGTVTHNFYSMGESATDSSHFYTRDHLNSVREVSDSYGNIEAQYEYEPYGHATKIQGELDSDFQYAGYFFDSTSGFNLTRHRAYSPTLGRWISRDPLGEWSGSNLCSYALNNPISFVDPSGLDSYLMQDPNQYAKFLQDAGLPPNSNLSSGCVDIVNSALKTHPQQLPEKNLDRYHTKCWYGASGFQKAKETMCCDGEQPVVWGKAGHWVGNKPLQGEFLGQGNYGSWNNKGGDYDYSLLNNGRLYDINHYNDGTLDWTGYSNEVRTFPLSWKFDAQMWCRTCK